MNDTTQPPSESPNLLRKLDKQQDDVLFRLDELNDQIESLLNSWSDANRSEAA